MTTPPDNAEFQALVWEQGRRLYRPMPWRKTPSLYYVIVSELMLQQTQVERVLPKFQQWVRQFPTWQQLADATLADVLVAWQGLGYNRRAKYVHQIAKAVVEQGEPTTYEELLSLPGIGKNTAGAVMNYHFAQATPFVETNIRTVYLHHFYPTVATVSDIELLERVTATIDNEHPREWYWALMDYGSFLKRQGVRNIQQSTHYKKQAPLQGSIRQVRGQIITQLALGAMGDKALRQQLNADQRYQPAIDALLQEGLITRRDGRYELTK